VAAALKMQLGRLTDIVLRAHAQVRFFMEILYCAEVPRTVFFHLLITLLFVAVRRCHSTFSGT